jgi:hypothetical protein
MDKCVHVVLDAGAVRRACEMFLFGCGPNGIRTRIQYHVNELIYPLNYRRVNTGARPLVIARSACSKIGWVSRFKL